MGAHVIVVNASQVRVTGHKETQKTYFRHTTGRPGAWHVERLCDLRRRLPCRIVERAVRGMLPHNRMGRFLFTRLKVYAGPEHPHASQSPVDITRDVDALKARAEETKRGVEPVSLDDALAASLAPLRFDKAARGR
ncbi:hypothetical protein H632_c1426p0 [Helicosporidium sp. ATCC 50920]|nr:hypothetical protein H632_c1426p0 [Helicosporidium sp. ATCC 50920]|eukprot:KDD74292.1 hypothetical protein H632_c1426p0 [Helicosporidium sp. ATCC 50920]